MLTVERHRLAALLFAATLLASTHQSFADDRLKIQVRSTLDDSQQASYLILPKGVRSLADDPQQQPVPLLVMLHSWSGNVEQRNAAFEQAAAEEGWIYLFPDFRGRNDRPEACGSLLAQQDILDATDWVIAHYPVDQRRIYLAGASGGGHMTMLMAGRHPDRWAAASAWVGISDLAAWHQKHAGGGYGKMLEQCCGGAPGASDAVDREYSARSPLTHLHNATSIPLDIAHGIHDGHQGSVPIRHSLEAFNAIAQAAGEAVVSAEEIRQLSQPDGRLSEPLESDRVTDPALGRKIHLRRYASGSRVTIFEGGHEGIASAAVDWLKKHVKPAE